MKYKIYAYLTLLSIALVFFSCSSDNTPEQQQMEAEDPSDDSSGGDQNEPEPSAFIVTSFSPTEAYTGETVTIVGDSIDLNTEYIVTFNDIESPRVTVTTSQIEAVIPNGEAAGMIRVQHDTFDIEVGTMDVTIENARVFGRNSATNSNILVTPESGLFTSTLIRRIYTDGAGISVWAEQVPIGQGFDVFTRILDYRMSEASSTSDFVVPYSTLGSSLNGRVFISTSFEDFSGVEINRIYENSDFSGFFPIEIFDYPDTYNLFLDPVFLEASQTIYYQATVSGQSGTFIWKFNPTTLANELLPYSNNFSTLTKSLDDRLVEWLS